MKKKVLLFEDDPVIMDLYKPEFDKLDIDTVFCPDYSDPVKVALEEEPDLILCNVIAKGPITGFEAIEILKSDFRTRDIPIMLFTNIEGEEDVERGKRLGTVGHLIKTHYSPAEVVQKIDLYFLNGEDREFIY